MSIKNQEIIKNIISNKYCNRNSMFLRKKPKDNLGNNIISNVIGFAISVLISIWYTPFMIHHLGVATYGLIPLITTVISYIGIITLSMNSVVMRYLTIELTKGDDKEANKIFNTSIILSLILSLIIALPSIYIYYNLNDIINIPFDIINSAKILCLSAFIILGLTSIRAPLEVATYFKNRFDLRNIASTGETLLRNIIIVLLFAIFSPNLELVSVANIVGVIYSTICIIYFWKNLTPNLKICKIKIDIQILKKLGEMSIWVIISQIGTILFIGIDLLVVNKIFGSLESGRYASILQWSVMLRGLSGAIIGVFGPTITKLYAKNEYDNLKNYSKKAIKIIGITLALPIGLISGLGKQLLIIWLGREFANLAPLMFVLTWHLIINLTYTPLHHISVATNNVRLPGILQIILGAMNFILAIILAKYSTLGIYGVAIAGIIVLAIKNSIFTPIYAAYILHLPKQTFIFDAVIPMLISLCITAISFSFSKIYTIKNWTDLILYSLILTILYIIFIFRFLFKKEELLFITKPIIR